MGVKLRSTVNPLEASISDGSLKIYFFDEVIKEVNLGIPKGITIERQYNFFNTALGNVIAFLSSDKYVVIIRFDGTVDVLTNNFVLLTRVMINTKLITDENMVIVACGSLSIKGEKSPAYLANLSTGHSFIFTTAHTSTLLLDLSDETNIAIKKWAYNHNDVGTLIFDDNSTGGTQIWVDYGTNDRIKLSNFKYVSARGTISNISSKGIGGTI